VTHAQVMCPSAQPEQAEAMIIGVVRGTDGAVSAEMLPVPLPIRPLIDLVPEDVRPTEVLRFAAPCMEGRCQHFRDGTCTLATRIIARLPAVSDRLRRCAIRPSCRWWRQEGAVACQRCPRVITEPYAASDLMREVARSPSRGGDSHAEP
jgi:hypothetical protein